MRPYRAQGQQAFFGTELAASPGTLEAAACRREGAMSRGGLKWSAVGLVSLLLVLLGAHLAWERHRYRLSTPKGVVRIGMTVDEVAAVLGPPKVWYGMFHPRPVGIYGGGTFQRSAAFPVEGETWFLDEGVIKVGYDRNGRTDFARYTPTDQTESTIPRPSLFAVVCSWLGKREER
jgi:hypothetical protein